MSNVDKHLIKFLNWIDSKLKLPNFIYLIIGMVVIVGGYGLSIKLAPSNNLTFQLILLLIASVGSLFITLGSFKCNQTSTDSQKNNNNNMINFETTASFDVDCQKGFTPLCPNELPVNDGHLIVDELNEQAKFAKFRVGSKDVHPDNAIWIATEEKPQFSPVDGENVDIRWNKHCMSGTRGAELLDGLPNVKNYDYFVFKGIEPDLHPYSACYQDLNKKLSTGAIEWLKVNGVDTVIVGGLATDFCVYQTVIDLLPHFRVIINKASTKSIGDFDATVKKLQDEGAIFVENASELQNIKL